MTLRTLSISRVRRGNHFSYLKRDEPVDESVKRRIERLAIPPAWENVEIAASPSAKVLAKGIDAAGRTQYIYNAKYRSARDQEKFERLAEFGAGLPEFRRELASNLRTRGLTQQRVSACVLTLIDQELFRVGSSRYADEHETYGVTTLEKQHLALTATRAILCFPGKSGSTFERTITDQRLVRVLSALADLPGAPLFQYCVTDHADDGVRQVTATAVNSLIKEAFGPVHTVKSFRTWGATAHAVEALASAEPENGDDAVTPEQERAAIRLVAERLENTPAVARESYIDPRVLEAFSDPDRSRALRRSYQRMRARNELSVAERLTLRIMTDDTP